VQIDNTTGEITEISAFAIKLRTASLDLSTPPFVRQHKLDDFYVVYELNAYSKEPSKMSRIYSEMHKHILEEFNAAGVEILSPHYRVDRGWGRK